MISRTSTVARSATGRGWARSSRYSAARGSGGAARSRATPSSAGHNVTFINDLYPRATTPGGQLQSADDWTCIPTLVKSGASIGSSATILAGVVIGENAIVGAGSVVTRDVSPNTVVAGNPARVLRGLEQLIRLEE